jgi:alcohol dehydrogenase class IV
MEKYNNWRRIMNFFQKVYCRTVQFGFKVALPILPYREPELIHGMDDIVKLLKEKTKDSVILVTDKGIRGLGLTKPLEDKLVSAGIRCSVYDGTVANPTTDNVEAAYAIYKENQCNAIIAFGGGSSMDCAKACGARAVYPKWSCEKMKGNLKLHRKLPLLIAIPTTAGTGSETTLAAVITDAKTRHKYAINSFPLIPGYAVIAPEVTVGLPKSITSTTGMDALTHAVEAYIGRNTNKYTRKCSKDACQLIFDNILTAYYEGGNIQARTNMLKASNLAGNAFTRSYVGYVHAVAHSLGGKYSTPHGLANSVLLPYVLKAYGSKIYKKLWDLSVYTGLCSQTDSYEYGAKKFIDKIEALNNEMNIPTKLADIKLEDIHQMAIYASKEGNPLYPVPVLMNAKELENFYYMVMEEKQHAGAGNKKHIGEAAHAL